MIKTIKLNRVKESFFYKKDVIEVKIKDIMEVKIKKKIMDKKEKNKGFK